MSPLVAPDHYAALERCTYFNQAALGLMPRSTVEVMHAFLEQTAQFGNLYLSDHQEAAILDGVRSAGAQVLGAPVEAVAVVGGASEALAQATSLLERDAETVVLVASDFPSLTYPWLAAAEHRDIRLRFVEDRPDHDLTFALIDAIDPTTSAVVFSAVQYATGSRVAVDRVTAKAHDVGARVLVDVSQLAGAGPVHMEEWDADAVVTSGYKWLSAHGGVALLALAPDLRDRLPRFVGWKSAENPFDFDAQALRLAGNARRFELSTMSYASAIGLEESIRFLTAAGLDPVERHARRLAAQLAEQVAPLGWRPYRPLTDPAASPHIVSLRHPGRDPAVIAERLASDHRIICGNRAGGLRISLHVFNGSTDIDHLAAALGDLMHH